MKLSVSIPHSMHVAALAQPWEYALRGPDIGRAMQTADRLGFHKCMLGEHFIIPTEHIALSGDHYFHSTVALAFVAGQTSRLRLSSSLSIVPLQNPIVQAKAWSTLDFLSAGRAEAMFGVGWLKQEFDVMRVPFHERGRMADEYVAAMQILWTAEKPEFDGKYVSFRDIGFAPKPVQRPHLPVWLGGDAEAVLHRVSKFADGWSPFRTPPEQIPDCIDRIKSHAEYDGRPLGVFFTLEMLNVGAHHEIMDDPRAPGTHDAQKIIDQIGWLKGLGITETGVPLPPGLTDLAAYEDRLAWVAAEIMSAVA